MSTTLHQQLLLLGLLAGLAASVTVHGLPTVGVQLVGFAEPGAINSTAGKVCAQLGPWALVELGETSTNLTALTGNLLQHTMLV
jgi:hypothetical protein